MSSKATKRFKHWYDSIAEISKSEGVPEGMITLQGLQRFEIAFVKAGHRNHRSKMKEREDFRGEYWWKTRDWARKEVVYKEFKLDLYDLTEEDRDGPFSHILKNGWPWQKFSYPRWHDTYDRSELDV